LQKNNKNQQREQRDIRDRIVRNKANHARYRDYGLIITYTGNQLEKVEDTASTSSVSLGYEADFRNRSNTATEYTYDGNGNLKTDLNKGISSDITYNYLNLPRTLALSNTSGSATNTYTYTADGRLLTVSRATTAATTTTQYAGNMIYENNTLKRILVDGGYIEGSTYYYYLTDHLGNNRVVANMSGTVQQANHYYPYGMTFDDSTSPAVQPYKYGGKEFDKERSLNWSDFHARQYMNDVPMFTTMDPLAEKYYSISPYAYVAGNPIKYVDPTGMFLDGYSIDEYGYIAWVNNEGGNEYDVLYSKYSSETSKDYDTSGNKTGIQISKGILVEGRNNMSLRTLKMPVTDYEGHSKGETKINHAYEVKNDNESLALMNFLDRNTDVEWGNTLLKDSKGAQINLLSTSHEPTTITARSYMVDKYVSRGFSVVRSDHIHPTAGSITPSGLQGDLGYGRNVLKTSSKAIFRILNNGKYYDYTRRIPK
jgi:RHS repeat-associated protein